MTTTFDVPQDGPGAESTVAAKSAPAEAMARADVAPASGASLPWTHWATVALVGLACSLLSVAAYHVILRRLLPPAIASVDLQGVVEAKELQFTDIVTRPSVTDIDRERAYQLVAKLPAELEAAINELRAECRCLVLVRAAVVGPAQFDLTSALRQKLGIGDLDVAALRERLRVTRLGANAAEGPARSTTPNRSDGSPAR